MQRQGLTPLESAAILAIAGLALVVTLPVAYRHLGKAHRQARIIRDWDASLSQAQEQAIQARSSSNAISKPTADDPVNGSALRTSAR
ncbi:MAG: hypothetical protein SFU85_10200 [Candidatus Methylacidiphilales bacterium]|nr:hypothetical protein [Candidatus Methylacidiphilales bacterium]